MMGCTSSTPNMVNTRTTEKSLHFEEDMDDNQSNNTEKIIYRASNDTTCDTLTGHNINIERNRSNPTLNSEKDDQEDPQFSVVSYKQTVSSDTIHEEENGLKLEEVVGKVVENINHTEPISKIVEETQRPQEIDDKDNINKIDDVGDTEELAEIEQDEQKKCHPEEAATASPSQSESSRATRWEALADIAAELPPSLTVDPITGQIYAVSK